MKTVKIVESTVLDFHYHLSETGKTYEPTLCGVNLVMYTLIPMSAWGVVSHINEKWCKKCWEIYKEDL